MGRILQEFRVNTLIPVPGVLPISPIVFLALASWIQYSISLAFLIKATSVLFVFETLLVITESLALLGDTFIDATCISSNRTLSQKFGLNQSQCMHMLAP